MRTQERAINALKNTYPVTIAEAMEVRNETVVDWSEKEIYISLYDDGKEDLFVITAMVAAKTNYKFWKGHVEETDFIVDVEVIGMANVTNDARPYAFTDEEKAEIATFLKEVGETYNTYNDVAKPVKLNDIIEDLKEASTARNWFKFAFLVGFKDSTIANWRKGNDIKIGNLNRILKALDIEPVRYTFNGSTTHVLKGVDHLAIQDIARVSRLKDFKGIGFVIGKNNYRLMAN